MAPSVGHSVYGRSKGGSDVLVKSDCVGMSGWKDRLNTRLLTEEEAAVGVLFEIKSHTYISSVNLQHRGTFHAQWQK